MIKNRFQKLIGLTVISLLTLSACGTNNDSFIQPSLVNTQIAAFNPGSVSYDPVVSSFLKNASGLGVHLNDNQLKEISMQRHVSPSTLWASRPALNLSSEQNLNIHFNKHKNEFKGIVSPNTYLQRAIEFQKRQSPSITYYFDTTSFQKGYQSNVVKHDARTKEFSAMKANGDLTTYYTSDIPSPKRFIVVHEDFSF